MTETDSTRDDESPDGQRTHVREEYATIATTDSDCCGSPVDDSGEGRDTSTAESDDCCGPASDDETGSPRELSLGYDPDDLEAAPDDSSLGLGCGNPIAISNLESGETVLDLGSGGGFDCFLAAREVGPGGHVIGVDMTPEMLDRARENARESEFGTVEFRLGEIEHLPVADDRVDVVISNCVINLSPAKRQVLEEAYRVLRPGGRLAISDLVATEPLPEAVRENPDAVNACVGGAATVDELETWLTDVGFIDVSITVEGEWTDDLPIVSARIEAEKPE